MPTPILDNTTLKSTRAAPPNPSSRPGTVPEPRPLSADYDRIKGARKRLGSQSTPARDHRSASVSSYTKLPPPQPSSSPYVTTPAVPPGRQQRAMASSASDVCLYFLAIFLPFVAVFLKTGSCCDLIINICLCCLAWIPGVIHAWWVISQNERRTVVVKERY